MKNVKTVLLKLDGVRQIHNSNKKRGIRHKIMCKKTSLMDQQSLAQD
jgi:hypothetical protein